ncbi:MAG: PAS domain S-box protein, partial [Armatimonadetes bacterium]|nr:PAS domain S-box protein [Armatimonadota bacterium]
MPPVRTVEERESGARVREAATPAAESVPGPTPAPEPGRSPRRDWLPIPALALAVLILIPLDIRTPVGPAYLVAVLNLTIFIAASGVAAALAGWGYLATGVQTILLLGGGMLAFGLACAASSVLLWLGQPGEGVAAHNTGALAASLFHLCSAVRLLFPPPAPAPRRLRRLRLLGVYGLAAAALAALTALASTDLLPSFVTPAGTTPLRASILSLAATAYFFSALLFAVQEQRAKATFFRWYWLGLSLVGLGVAAVAFAQVGSPLAWVGRISQALGQVYVLLCLLAVVRQRGGANTAETLGLSFRRVEREHAAIWDAAAEGIVVANEAGAVVYANRRMEEVLGAADGELVGRAIADVLQPRATLAEREQLRSRLLRSGQRGLEVRGIGADGSCVVALVNSSVTWDARGRVAQVVALVSDITERTRALEALREAERKYRELVRHAPTGIYEIDFRERRFLSVNDAICDMLGYTREEMLAMDPFRILDEEGHARFQARIAMWLNGEKPSSDVEYRIRAKDGRAIDALMNSTFTTDKDGRPVGATVVAHDISERKRAEESLRDRENDLRLIMDAAPALISYVDTNLRYRRVNRAYERWFGHRAEDIRGRHVRDVLGEAAFGAVRPHLERALAGEVVTYEQEIPYEHTGKRWVHVTYTPDRDESGRVRGLVTQVIDVGDRKRAEAALRESEERFRGMADGTPVMIWVTDPEGRMEFVNRAYCEFFGTTIDRVTARGWQPLVHPDDAEQYVGAYVASLRERKPFRAEARVRRHDGEWRWIESHGQPRFSESGEFLGCAGSSPDITERKLAEEALRDADRRKDEFLAMLSHELRNPLAAVAAAMEVLRLAPPGDPRAERARDAAGRQVWHMKRLIDDLLDVARITRGQIELRRQEVTLDEVLENAIAIARPAIEAKGHHFTAAATRAQRDLALHADVARLAQVVANLLDNAAKYTPDGGRIHLEVRSPTFNVQGSRFNVQVPGLGVQGSGSRAADATANSEPATPNPERGTLNVERGTLPLVEIHVRDNGMGIPSGLLPHVFDLFVQ